MHLVDDSIKYQTQEIQRQTNLMIETSKKFDIAIAAAKADIKGLFLRRGESQPIIESKLNLEYLS